MSDSHRMCRNSDLTKLFVKKSTASGFAFGNNVANGFFFRNGSARMYSRDRCEVIA